MFQNVKQFLEEYAPWTAVDLLIYTKTGNALVVSVVLAIMSGLSYLTGILGSLVSRHDLGVIVFACLAVAIGSLLLSFMFSSKTKANAPTASTTEPAHSIASQLGWIPVIIAISLILYVARGIFREHQTSNEQQGGGLLAPFFSFEGITRLPNEATVAEGKKLAFNTHIINPAPRTSAYNAVCEQGLFLEPPDRNGERLAGEAFDSQIRAKREDYLANKIPNGAVIGNAPQWYTLQT